MPKTPWKTVIICSLIEALVYTFTLVCVLTAVSWIILLFKEPHEVAEMSSEYHVVFWLGALFLFRWVEEGMKLYDKR